MPLVVETPYVEYYPQFRITGPSCLHVRIDQRPDGKHDWDKALASFARSGGIGTYFRMDLNTLAYHGSLGDVLGRVKYAIEKWNKKHPDEEFKLKYSKTRESIRVFKIRR